MIDRRKMTLENLLRGLGDIRIDALAGVQSIVVNADIRHHGLAPSVRNMPVKNFAGLTMCAPARAPAVRQRL